MNHFDLIVSGGRADANMKTLIDSANDRGLKVLELIQEPGAEPAISWDPTTNVLTVEGEEVTASGLYLRYDVFGPGLHAPDPGKADRAMAWYATLVSWAFASPQMRLFNRHTTQAAGYKGYAIARAAHFGVPLPKTRLTNDARAVDDLGTPETLIAKPAAGGSYTAPMEEALDEETWVNARAPSPAIVQEKLIYPEVRVYLVGTEAFVFETHSTKLDFRTDPVSQSTYLPNARIPLDMMARLKSLAKDLGLDFCAFDLKTREETGELCFLEVNSGPMVTAFDEISGGDLARSMALWLAQQEAKPTALAAE